MNFETFKEKANDILSSHITPIACLLIAGIVNQFTYAKSGAQLFRVIEVVLFIIGFIATLRVYSSWVKYALLLFCVIGIYSSGSDLLGSTQSDIGDTGYTQGGGDTGYTRFRGDTGYTRFRGDTGYTEEPIRIKCNRCFGSGKCQECNGTGRITIRKEGINLGGGSSYYNSYQRCPLCDGDRDCIYCNGTGYRQY